MSTPGERARAVVWAGALVVQLSRNGSLPLELRRQATVIARHFPTIEDVARLPTQADFLAPDGDRLSQKELDAWCTELENGPLTDSTRLGWPD